VGKSGGARRSPNDYDVSTREFGLDAIVYLRRGVTGALLVPIAASLIHYPLIMPARPSD
jgi:hypothetical protein